MLVSLPSILDLWYKTLSFLS